MGLHLWPYRGGKEGVINLVERARLTEEEEDAVLDVVPHPGEPSGALLDAIADAQLAKAMWAVVDWLATLPATYTPEQAGNRLCMLLAVAAHSAVGNGDGAARRYAGLNANRGMEGLVSYGKAVSLSRRSAQVS